MRIDELDKQIIKLLTEDARASFRAVGDRVGLSAPAVKRRVDRLVAEGSITRFTAQIDPRALGWQTQGWIAVTYAGNVTPSDIREILAPMPNVVAAYTVSGDADVLVHLRATDMSGFERALERIRATGAVARTESTIVLSTLLDRTHASTADFAEPPGTLPGAADMPPG